MVKRSISENCIDKKSQQGAALLLFFIVMMLTGVIYFVSNLSVVKNHSSSEQVTSDSLAKAKEALLSYAISYYEKGNNMGKYGFLPCPETGASGGNEGNEAGNCTPQYEHALGRLPWKTLDIEPLKDGSGECLWYAVSGVYKNGSGIEAEMHNDDSVGMFELYDENANPLKAGSATNRVVAVVVAPGARLNGLGQNRLSADSNLYCKVADNAVNPSDYLEIIGVHDNATFDNLQNTDTFISARNQQNININDRVITITQEEIFSAIRNSQKFQQRMNTLIESVSLCVNEYITTNPVIAGGCDLTICLDGCTTAWSSCTATCNNCVPQCDAARNACIAAGTRPNICNQIRRDCRRACPRVNTCTAACDATLATCQANCNATCTPGGGGGGGNNYWLPWPAPVNLSAVIDDYRLNTFYDDAASNQTPGRLPDTIVDSSLQTTNIATNMFANCSVIAPVINSLPANINFTDDNNDEYKILWRHWKDHIFYAIGSGFEPSNAPGVATPDCTGTPIDCVEVIDAGGISRYYAAIVIFSGSVDPALQTRELAVDRADYANYLDSYNVGNNSFSFTTGQDSSDIAYCISAQRVITKCSP